MLRKLSYVLAGFIVIIALLVLVSRLLIPVLDEHRADIETWASSFLGMPVQIAKARVSWYQYYPVITLNKVTILDKTNKQPIIQIDQLRVLISIPQSLWQRHAVLSGLVVSGVELNLYEKSTGEIAVQGFPALGGFSDQPYSNETRTSDILSWIAAQPLLILNNIDLRYADKNGIKRYLSILDLRCINDSDDHSIFGKVLLHQAVPTELAATIEWQGDVTDFKKIHADIYLYATKLALTQWLKDYTYQGWQLNTGTANARIWATWDMGAFNRIQTTFEAYGLTLLSASDNATHKISRLSANIGWKHEGLKHIIAGDDVFIDLPQHLWPSTSFYMVFNEDAQGKLIPEIMNFGYLDLKDVQQYLASFPGILSNDMNDTLKHLQITGDVQSLASHFSAATPDLQTTAISLRFAHVGMNPWKQFPGVKNASGVLAWHDHAGELSLQSQDCTLNYDTIFANAIKLKQLTGSIKFQQDAFQTWQLTLGDLQAENDDLLLDVKGDVSIPANNAASINIAADFNLKQVKNVTQYLPMKIFEPGLNTWLRPAFLGGTLDKGHAVIRGNLHDFPFANGSGEFTIVGNVNDVDFHFAPNWPNLSKLNGKVTFSGIRMLAEVASAEIMGIPIKQVVGDIPSLGGAKPAILTVKAQDIKMDFKQGMTFVQASPLQKTIGSMFTNAELSGPINLALNLTVPLADPDKTTVNGDIAMTDTAINLPAWRLQANKLNGTLHFTENSSSADNMTGMLFDKPMLLTISTPSHGKGPTVTRATIKNNLAVSDLENWLKMPFSKVVNGSAAITADIDFQLNAPIKSHIQSNLVGINVLLPDQYAKSADKPRQFSADLIAQDKHPLMLNLNYGNVLGVALILKNIKNTFTLTAADVSIGSGKATWPEEDGLYISGNIPKLDWAQIKSYSSSSGKTAYVDLPLRGIDVTIGRLELLSEVITSAHIDAIPGNEEWDIVIESHEIDGQIRVPNKMLPQDTIVAQLHHLNLSTGNSTSVTKIDSRSLPSISFSAESVNFNNLPLGRVNFKTSPGAGGLVIQSLTVDSPHMSLTSSGNWTSSGTRLKGSVHSDNVSQFLSSLGYDVHNFISSKGKVDFQFAWSKPPYALTLASMSGTANLDMAQGRIVELGQSTGAKMDLGRMLNIFSLQTIPRRLNFDFSDVFQKGYSFDSLRGDFKFDNGNAFTANTKFNGPVAGVSINGRIGLVAKDYDLTLSVTPYVTSSIPVAATLLTGQPVIGLAAWAVDKVISSGVTKVTTYYYAVSGPWSNPAWGAVKTR